MAKWLLAFFFFGFAILSAEEASQNQCVVSEVFSETSHSVTIQGKAISYKATAGNLVLKDCKEKQTASMFFVAYTKEGVENTHERPITFCFNGGPGSASVWLNIGVFGPRKLVVSSENSLVAPYHFVDNPDSLLDLTDLVFIDPVSAGHSIAAPGVDPKDFHGVTEDVKSFAEFIRAYLSRYQRWNSPKFIAGESYGTTRAGALSYLLLDDYGIYLNGVVLVSSILNFSTKNFTSNNDLPYMLTLPTYTAIAWYHKKLPNVEGDLRDLLAESEEFALNDYALALLKGDNLNNEDKNRIAARISELTGLSEKYVQLSNLRVQPHRFSKELLRSDRKILGRFDGRYTGFDKDVSGDSCWVDPSMHAVFGAFTAAFNDYLARELKWQSQNQYFVIADVQPWNWGKANQYLDTSEDLARAMTHNPNMKVFVASGYYDLATPYFATVYTFDHLGLDPLIKERLFMYEYEGGHMMYLSQPILEKLRRDLDYFYKNK